MEVQRQWSRGESSKGSSERENVSRRCRRIRTGDVLLSGRTPVSSSLVASQQEGRTMNTTITEAVGSYRTKINLENQDDIEMIGYGDFRGVYQEDLNSRN